MNGPRRRFLVVTGGLAAGVAGCLAETASDRPAGVPETPEGEPTRTTESATDYPATVNATTTVERDEIEYVEENDTVRYVAAYGDPDEDEEDDGSKPVREPIYETVPFEEWADVECASVGSKRVRDAMAERLDGETEGVSAGITREDGEV